MRRGLLALLLLAAPLSGAAGGARKPVRVAYLEFNRLMEVDAENKPVSGYAFEYIQTIGTYAHWDVEYVPCDSFADGVKRLLAGEVDLIYEISYTEERAKDMLFPDEPMGFEEDREKSRRAGMNGHIAKPLKIAEVLRELDRFAT